jgi:hypothetical protein
MELPHLRGNGKDNRETRTYTDSMEDLLSGHGARLIFSTSFDNDPFLLALAKKYPEVVFRQASVLASGANPPNVGSQNALIPRDRLNTESRPVVYAIDACFCAVPVRSSLFHPTSGPSMAARAALRIT